MPRALNESLLVRSESRRVLLITIVILGVFDEKLVDLMANALMELGWVDHGVVVHGCGLDEISPLGSSTIFEIKASAQLSPEGKKLYTSSRFLIESMR